MQKFLTLLCAAALVIAFTGIASAEVQSIKVSGDITTHGIYRNDFDLNDNSSNDDDRGFVQSTTRLRVDADLTDNVSTTVRLINERDWGGDNSGNNDTSNTAGAAPQLETQGNTNFDNDIDLDLASITLKDFLYSPLTVTVGRQELRWGNGFVLGDPDSNDASAHTLIAPEFSRRKAFDAVRAMLDFDPITLDGFFSHLSEGSAGTNNDRDLFGVEANYAFSERSANVAGYFLGEKNLAVDVAASTATQWSGDAQESAQAQVLGREIYTVGGRGSIEPTTGLNLMGEVAFQFGEIVNGRDQSAWALQTGATYAVDHQWKPSLRANFVYFSGEETGGPEDSTDDHEGWIANFEDQTWGIIANQLGRSSPSGGVGQPQTSLTVSGDSQSSDTNMWILDLGASVAPIKDVTVGADWYHFVLNEENDTVGGAGAGQSLVFTNEKDFGDELDFTATYNYTEDLTFGGSLAFFFPGDAFESDAQDTAFQGMGTVEVVF